jgi:biotin-(acetyl-CoA carboxylase) ligase
VQALDIFVKEGFAPFQAEYERLNLLLGKRVRFSESGMVVTGKVLSIGSDGKLYMSLDNGASKGYLSGEVSGIELVADSEEFVHGFPDAK